MMKSTWARSWEERGLKRSEAIERAEKQFGLGLGLGLK